MPVNLAPYCNQKIACSCGREHYCPIEQVIVQPGALQELPGLLRDYRRIFLAADTNTYAVCGQQVSQILQDRLGGQVIYRREGLLVPDETSIAEMEAALPADVDCILGVGSGVINDLCKYVSFHRNLPYGIVATAPSMDGYASSGAAMILGGMKVTETTRPPKWIVADVDVVKNAPMDMILAGYGDIVGKYSSLNDWKLAALIRGEHFCQEICDLVMTTTQEIHHMADRITAREPEAIGELTRALVLIGVTLSLLGSTRPGSGSEHHLSHFFEIVGLTRNEPYFIHGTDVAYSTIVTAHMREKILALETPVFAMESAAQREAAWERIYGPVAGEVKALQVQAGSYARNLEPLYVEKWPQIREILSQCPTAKECAEIFQKAGYRLEAFTELYGESKIHDAMLYGKDLKDRYSVLWLYYSLFSGERSQPHAS